jgi:hypothetical protein
VAQPLDLDEPLIGRKPDRAQLSQDCAGVCRSRSRKCC